MNPSANTPGEERDGHRLRDKLRRAFGYLDWIFNPFQRRDVAQIYDLLATGAVTEHGLYLNLGYWREAQDLDQASVALANLVAETAQIGPGETVLDAGFGFADQDLLWARSHRPARIVGLNVTASQVALASRRVAQAGLDGCIELLEASATAMPVEDGSVDAVVALESAFHFQSREAFFREAWRVLRPGGRLVTADILPLPLEQGRLQRLKQRLSWWLVASRFAIPEVNRYGIEAYRDKLTAAGFDSPQVTSIREAVYAPLHRWLAAHPHTLAQLHPVARIPARMARRLDARHVYAGLDYVLASAVKR